MTERPIECLERQHRDIEYTTWLTTENNCMLRMRAIGGRFSLNDVMVTASDSSGKTWGEWMHLCWSSPDRPPIDPAHVGKHRSKGAPDFGHTVPLCHAAHAFYDAHRSEWKRVTGWTEAYMASAASGYALKYVESGGAPPERETPE